MLLAVVITVFYLLEKESIKSIFNGISYDIKSSCDIVEIGEEFFLETTITNAKRLPITSLITREILPEGLALSDDNLETIPHHRGTAFVSDTYLLPRRKLTRTLKAALPCRGRYFFYGASLTAGSLLGFSTIEKNFHLTREVLLPPKAAPSLELKRMLGNYLGDISVNRFIMKDPVLTVGFREYSGFEPMRSICWKQTARAGKLMVKNYDHTFDLTVTVILNIHTLCKDFEIDVETLFSMARSVCEFLETMETPYRFVTNAATIDGTGQKSVIPDGMGGSHLVLILKLLARATYNHFENFEEMIAKIAQTAEQGRAHILLTTDVTASAAAFLHKLRVRTGRDILILTPGMIEPNSLVYKPCHLPSETEVAI